MMKIYVIVIMVLILFSFGYTQPKISVGFKATRFMIGCGDEFQGSEWDYEAIYELYWGFSSDLSVDFTKNLSLRVEVLEYKIFDNTEGSGNGGSSISLFSNLDADIIYVLPIGSRLSPLVYAGLNYERFMNKPVNDLRGVPVAAYEMRAGLGAQYKLRQKVRLFLELQIFNKCGTGAKRVPLDDMLYWDTCETLGLNRINLGLRLGL